LYCVVFLIFVWKQCLLCTILYESVFERFNIVKIINFYFFVKNFRLWWFILSYVGRLNWSFCVKNIDLQIQRPVSTNLCDIPLSQFQQPVVKGDRLAIEIPEAAYEAGLEACKHNLHGRILWPKGSTPLSVVALKAKLASIWKDLSRWGVISIWKDRSLPWKK
jgi:hypothetical protein